jgi:rhomboid protease GluP
MCPNCRAFITIDDKVCPYCDVPVPVRGFAAADTIAGLIPHAQFVTSLILLINGALFAATVISSYHSGNSNALSSIDRRTLLLFGAKAPGGEMWRLITAGFLHGGLMHFLMNTWAMFDLSATVEDTFGAKRMVVIYMVSTVTGFMASSMWSLSISVGASAGLFGLLGAMIAAGSMSGTLQGFQVKAHYKRWAIYSLLFGIITSFGMFATDNAAHVGGLAGGYAAARIAGRARFGHWSEQVVTVVFYACIACAVYAFFRMAQTFARFS